MAKQGKGKEQLIEQKGKLTDQQKKNIEALFTTFDTDSSNTLTTNELKTGLRVFYGENITEAEFQQIFKDWGLKPGQPITKDKFYDSMEKYYHRSKSKTAEEKRKELEAAFRVFDKDNSGYIEKAELGKVLTELGDKMTKDEVETMFNLADTDKDGKIRRQEYVDFFMKHIK